MLPNRIAFNFHHMNRWWFKFYIWNQYSEIAYFSTYLKRAVLRGHSWRFMLTGSMFATESLNEWKSNEILFF